MIRPQGDQRGSMVAWLLVIAPVLLVFMGLVLDGGAFMLRGQMLDAASDAAALAATDAWDRDHWLWHGKVQIDPGRAETLARAYLRKNMPSARLVRLTVGPPNRVYIETETQMPFFFMRIIGWKEQTVTSTSTAVRRDVNP